MDNKPSPRKEVAEELTRELLIAISNLEPDSPVDMTGQPKVQPESKGENGAAVTNEDNAEKYRSKLMSISELSPPQTSPVAMDP